MHTVILNDILPSSLSDRQFAEPTPGVREQASPFMASGPGSYPGAGNRTGWHHHSDHDTSVYVVEGTVRIEVGPMVPTRWTPIPDRMT